MVVITHDQEIAALAPRQIRIRDGVLEAAPVTSAGSVASEQPLAPVAAPPERGA